VRRFTKQELEQASEMWKSGQTYLDIMPFLNVTKRRFNELCQRRRDLFPKRYEERPEVDINKVAEMWMAGTTKNDIADALGVKRHVILRIIHEDVDGIFPPRAMTKDGFTFEPKKAGNPMTPDRIDQAVELWAQGMLAKDIAGRLGVTLKNFERVRLVARDRFPFRSNKTQAHSIAMSAVTRDTKKRREDVMLWKTFSGAFVSLPRVSILAGRM